MCFPKYVVKHSNVAAITERMYELLQCCTKNIYIDVNVENVKKIVINHDAYKHNVKVLIKYPCQIVLPTEHPSQGVVCGASFIKLDCNLC